MARKTTAKAEPKKKPTGDEAILEEARERFAYCVERESEERELQLDDLRFLALEQWPDEIKRRRESDKSGARPCLVVDKVNQYVRQVVNDMRQNRPQIKVRAVDDNADVEVAKKYDGLVRHIQDWSRADQAYDWAGEQAVSIGVGFFRIVTEYANASGMDQEILIKRIRNRFSVYLDPDYQEADGCDACYGFVTERIKREKFERDYPESKALSWEEAKGDLAQWCGENDVRVAEYLRIVQASRTLVLFEDGSTKYEDELGAELADNDAELDAVAEPKSIRRRSVVENRCEWFKLTGNEVLERSDFPSSYIPIIPVHGSEMDIEGKRIRCGMVRPAKDAQRMHNYQRSTIAEMLAYAPKAPFIGTPAQFEGFEDKWAVANRESFSYLPYNAQIEGGTLVPPPGRIPFPAVPVGLVQDAQSYEHDIQAAVGMYGPSLGAPSNEKSGRALLAQQREGDTGSFHYSDNLARSIRHAGRIIVEMIPQVFDTARQARILGEDGSEDFIRLNPALKAPMREYLGNDGAKMTEYNLGVGKYDVSVTVGPSYNTKRMEAADAMVQLSQANQALFPVIGDLVVRNMDWPGAQEIADRLKKLLPPQLQEQPGEDGEPLDPKLVQAMGVIKQLQEQLVQMQAQGQAAIQEVTQKAGFEKMRADQAKAATEAANLSLQAEKIPVEKFSAETDRMKAETDRLNAQNASLKAMSEAQSAGVEVGQDGALTTPLAAHTQTMAEMMRAFLETQGAILQQIAAGQAMQAQAFERLAAVTAAPRVLIRDEAGRPAASQIAPNIH